ncbi:hypothetical protein Tco_0232019 [Tanacetum coccineum]
MLSLILHTLKDGPATPYVYDIFRGGVNWDVGGWVHRWLMEKKRRRGISKFYDGKSKFYDGKSKSYGSLADAAKVSSIQDIVKKEDAYSRKRKNMIAHTVLLEALRNSSSERDEKV